MASLGRAAAVGANGIARLLALESVGQRAVGKEICRKVPATGVGHKKVTLHKGRVLLALAAWVWHRRSIDRETGAGCPAETRAGERRSLRAPEDRRNGRLRLIADGASTADVVGRKGDAKACAA